MCGPQQLSFHSRCESKFSERTREHNPDDYETEIYHDECKDNGESYDYGYDCECQYAVKEVYDEEGGYMDEEECTGYLEDPDCECQEWMDAEVELFWWPIKKSYYFGISIV